MAWLRRRACRIGLHIAAPIFSHSLGIPIEDLAIPATLQIDKIQYPDRKVVERCAMIRDFGDKTKDVLEIWSRIKGDNLGVGITILIFVVVGLMSGWMIYKRIQRYKHKKMQRRRSRRRKKQR